MNLKKFLILPILFCISLTLQSQSIIRGPYLQKATPTSIVVKWRTDVATSSAVQYGSTFTNLTDFEQDNMPKIDHEVEITGLTADTQYYYQISNNSTILKPAAIDLYFKTLPAFNSQPDFSAWIVGDCGTANNNQRAVRDAYYTYYGNNPTDAMLFLGDNAYVDGTDSEYQYGVFENMYEDKLKNTVAWSTMGNHDGRSASAANQTGPYYDIFTFPTNGESGGLASGTEAYYSFDYGNIHFIVLDSYESDRSVGSAMFNWCLNDIQNTTGDWIVALWHHPPYSKGSHNSDTESYMVEMRENFLPMMEFYGLDLVFSGHSHSYERSNLINGHYDTSPNYDPNIHTIGAAGSGDGQVSGDGAYVKDSTGDDVGTVYIVAGSSGKITPAPLNHPIMEVSLAELGSCMLNISGDTLSVQFLRETGVIDDHFSIVKHGISGTNNNPCNTEWADVVNIFNNNTCTTSNCHGGSASGLNLTTFNNFMAGGNQCGSDIITGNTLTNIITTGANCSSGNITPMNSFINSPVSPADIATLQEWIDNGAPEFCGNPPNYCNNPCYVEYNPNGGGMPDNTLCLTPLSCADNPPASCITSSFCNDNDPCTISETESIITLTSEVCTTCGNGQSVSPSCGDPNANNYNANATCIDNALCTYNNYCDNPCYLEYNPSSTGVPDNTLCITPLGCADNPQSTCITTMPCNDNDPCTTSETITLITLTGEVCGSCGNGQTVAPACGDPLATNYNANATCIDNSLCVYNNNYCNNPCYAEYNPTGVGMPDNSLCISPLSCADNPQSSCITTMPCNDSDPCTTNETISLITLTGEVCVGCGNGQAVSPSCGDPTATNYNANATCIDNSLCTYGSYCDNPCYIEYNPIAGGQPDNNLCITPLSCADNPSAFCTTTIFCNDNDECTNSETEIIITLTNEVCVACGNGNIIMPACGDPTASNFNPNAVCIDNSLCQYNSYCDNPCYVEYNPTGIGVADMDECQTPLACADNPSQVCLTVLNCDDSDDCTTGETQTMVSLTGELCQSCGNGNVVPPSCGDPLANNYNPNASCIDNDLCSYNTYCNNPCYVEYNPNATGVADEAACNTPLGCADAPGQECLSTVACDDGDDCTENEQQTIISLTGEVCLSCGGGNQLTADCGDPAANNYNAQAICIDNSLCTYDIETYCDNPCYEEYNPNGNGEANENECINALPCANAPTFCLNEQVCFDNDDCTENEIEVTLIATGEVCETCIGEVVEPSCSDPNASNYVANALCIDDAVCVYDAYCNNPCYEEYNPNGMGDANEDACINALSCADAPDACKEFQVCDDNDPCTTNENQTILITTGEVCINCSNGEPVTAGCSDPNASNYNENATCIDNDTCIYDDIYCGSPCYEEYEPNGVGIPDLAACFTPLTCADNPSSECQIIQPCEGDPCISGGLEIILAASGEVCVTCFNFTTIEAACGDPDALNYDADATCIDNDLCEYNSSVYCNSPCYEEYNPNGDGQADMDACITPLDCANAALFSECFSYVACSSNDPCLVDPQDVYLLATGELCNACVSDAILPPSCNDPLATNYNADADCIDNDLCEYEYFCKSPCYEEYNPIATGLQDESLCINALGCADGLLNECLTFKECAIDPNITEVSVTATGEICTSCKSTSINEFNWVNSISFYPNPADEQLNISISDLSLLHNVEVSIINLYGQTVISTNMTNSNQTIDVSKLAVGIYLVQSKFGESFKIEKLLIE